MLGPMLLTWHNLHYYQELMQGLRGAIEAGTLDAFVAKFAADRAQNPDATAADAAGDD
jgi:queuine tRNA-ribosyltransferase